MPGSVPTARAEDTIISGEGALRNFGPAVHVDMVSPGAIAASRRCRGGDRRLGLEGESFCPSGQSSGPELWTRAMGQSCGPELRTRGHRSTPPESRDYSSDDEGACPSKIFVTCGSATFRGRGSAQTKSLIQVKACGICGSDVTRIRRQHRPPYPTADHGPRGRRRGGGGWGRCALVPAGRSSHLRLHSLVRRVCVLSPWRGESLRYAPGARRFRARSSAGNGAFAEYVAVPQHIVYPLPDSFDYPKAALIEAVLDCGARGPKSRKASRAARLW